MVYEKKFISDISLNKSPPMSSPDLSITVIGEESLPNDQM